MALRKKLTFAVLGLSLVMIGVYMFIYRHEPFLFRSTNALFLVGAIDLLIALLCHVRNGGTFRSLGYFNYRRYKTAFKKRKDEGEAQEGPEMDFVEYSENKYASKWDAIPFYICGGPLLILSIVVLLFLPA